MNFLPHIQVPGLLFSSIHGNNNSLQISSQKNPKPLKTSCSCSVTSSHPLSYGGWDDFRINGGSVNSAEDTQLNIFLNSVGIGDKKYVFVYLFGFVCALAIYRVKVSSIVVFPACAFLFALGFSVGLVRRGNAKESKSNGNRRKPNDEIFNGFIKNLKNLRDRLNGYNAMVLNLKNDIKQRIEQGRVTMHDLEGYIHAIESTDIAFLNEIHAVESCIESIINGNQDKDEGTDRDSIVGRKKLRDNGLNLSEFFYGLVGGKDYGSKTGKTKDYVMKELNNMDVNNQNQKDILVDTFKIRNMNSVLDPENENPGVISNPLDRTVRGQNRATNYGDGFGVKNNEYQKKILAEENDASKSVFDQTSYDYQNNPSRSINNQQAHARDYMDDIETFTSHNDSVNFSIHMKRMKTASYFGHQRKHNTVDRNYWYSESIDEDRRESQGYSYRKEIFDPERQTNFNYGVPPQVNAFDSSSSSALDDDLEFNSYFTEANNLLKEAKGYLRHQVSDDSSDKVLHKSAILLSKAIEIRPRSSLAVSQLGNTYLLHGELKLKTARELRSLLTSIGPSLVEEGDKLNNKFEYQVADKEKIKMVLTNVCEKCEELLIKAGRKFKVVLSIDGNDMKALYNWGLALSLRAELIADIGPSAAHDADRMLMAAIDKFDAMLSKSNDYAPDALFKWGAALQHRSRLRPRNSREKMKLLQQARRLYEDALHMDFGNLELQEALSSCESELNYWFG